MGAVKIDKAQKFEVDAFLGQLFAYGMQLKGMLMMQNLKGIESLSSTVEADARRLGLMEVADSLAKVKATAKAGDFGGCMAAVSGYETAFHDLKVDYV